MVAYHRGTRELAGLKWDVLETIGAPEKILAGSAGERLALKKQSDGKIFVVVYREDAGGRLCHHRVSDAARSRAQPENTNMAVTEIAEFLKIVPTVQRTPHKYLWSSYDAEADVLYINFKKPSHATDSELTEDDVLVRYEGDEVVGLTVLHASQR